MKMHRVVFTFVLLALALGTFTRQYAQTATPEDTEQAKRSLAINLLRAINTAELAYRHNHDAYAPWATLVVSPEFTDRGMKWAEKHDKQLGGVHFADAPEILPGWNLRLDLTADGKDYDVLLIDTTDKACGYAALTDERGVIRQSKTIDCKI